MIIFPNSTYYSTRKVFYRLQHVYDVCQFTEILWCPGRLCQIVNRDLMVPRLCQFYTCRDIAEISWRPDYVNLQRFCRDSMVPRLCQFTEISWCPDYVNLQRFHGAPTMSIYRDFAEILRCPDYVNLQRFYVIVGAPTMSIYRDFT